MSTVRLHRPRVKPICSYTLDRPPEGPVPGLVTLAVGKDVAHYYLYPLPSDFGRAYRVEKFHTQGGSSYDVLLDGPHASCECAGFLRWGHCRHADGLRHLHRDGLLPPPAARQSAVA